MRLSMVISNLILAATVHAAPVIVWEMPDGSCEISRPCVENIGKGDPLHSPDPDETMDEFVNRIVDIHRQKSQHLLRFTVIDETQIPDQYFQPAWRYNHGSAPTVDRSRAESRHRIRLRQLAETKMMHAVLDGDTIKQTQIRAAIAIDLSPVSSPTLNDLKANVPEVLK